MGRENVLVGIGKRLARGTTLVDGNRCVLRLDVGRATVMVLQPVQLTEWEYAKFPLVTAAVPVSNATELPVLMAGAAGLLLST